MKNFRNKEFKPTISETCEIARLLLETYQEKISCEDRLKLHPLIRELENTNESHLTEASNKYAELFEHIMNDSGKQESSLANIFKISEEDDREITQIDIEILKYFLPKKAREEFMGDMYELIAEMENKGRKKSFIWFVIIFQYALVILGQLKSFIPFTSSNKEIADK